MKTRFRPSHRDYSVLACLLMLVSACGGGGGGGAPESVTPPAPVPPPVAPAPPQIKLDGFTTVSGSAWDNTAVRKVLHAFAFGSHAADAQIETWAGMDPSAAIMQMLTFDEHNVLLSPPSPRDTDGLPGRSGKLRALGEFWASDDPANGVPAARRERFDYSPGNGWLEHLWPMAVTMRGLNPFRQRIVYWEANQHLAVNLAVGIGAQPLLSYYDDIAEALENDAPYDQLLATAAASVAIAIQYGHHNNRWFREECLCNEDFAREFYQLFFGIAGRDDPHYHETVTIKNTAKALTGMLIERIDGNGFTQNITYEEEFHYPGTLEMLGQNVDGTNAKERLQALAAVSINHPESLANVPVMIIGGLADDNLDAPKIDNIRRAWADMEAKDLLLFLRAYAISDMFHSEERIKYLTTLERRLLINLKLSQTNEEIYQQVFSVIAHMVEGIKTFQPIDNVFGGQTGEMAANSAAVFRANFNQNTLDGWTYRRSSFSADDYQWSKDWRLQIPAAEAGEITVADATTWLWNHFLADGGKHLGDLERAHLYSIVATGNDLAYTLDPDDPEAVYTAADVGSDPVIIELIASLGARMTRLHDPNAVQRRRANERLGQAVNFITATPYMLYQEGR